MNHNTSRATCILNAKSYRKRYEYCAMYSVSAAQTLRGRIPSCECMHTSSILTNIRSNVKSSRQVIEKNVLFDSYPKEMKLKIMSYTQGQFCVYIIDVQLTRNA